MKNYKREIMLLLGPLIFFILFILPPLPGVIEAASEVGSEISKAPQLAFAVLLWTAIWWVSEVVPLGLAGLIPPLIFSFLNIVSWKKSLSSFMDPVIWIFMGGFVLAKAFQIWGLDKRIAIKLSSLYKGNNPLVSAFFIAGLPPFLLTMTGSITASTSIVFPIVMAFIGALNLEKEKEYAEALMLLLGQAATAGAMFLLISTPPNLVAKKVIEEFVPGVTITFFDWLIIGTPHALIGLFIAWFVIFKVIKVEKVDLSRMREKLNDEASKLGVMSKGEKYVFLIFLFVLFLWMLPGMFLILSSSFKTLVSLANIIQKILPTSAPAVLALLLLGLIHAEGRPLLRWKELEEGIDWNVIFLFGGGIVLGTGLQNSGFSKWLINSMMFITGSTLDFVTIIFVSALLGFIITYPASNTASSLITAPIAASLALSGGFNPIPAVLASALACSISSALPSTTPPMAIVYGSKHIKLWNMFRVGMVSDTIRFIILLVLTPYLTQMLCYLKGIPIKISP
ncbi:MAG: DASS family sodium-coupled anion symporter [Thermoproteales archaeon]|nr:DASS family sodium-coupled anion symporter [Thermoproteales archaeon]